MHAWLIRPERFGKPMEAFQKEVVNVPPIADDEVLVYVMAAGINYNNVWAGLGIPVNVIGARNKAGEKEEFHIGGSDASGIVYKVGKDVTNVKVGDEVVMHCGQYSRHCAWVKSGGDPDVLADLPHLGLRNQLGQLRPVHQSAGAAMHAQAQAHELGRSGGLHAGGGDRLADAAWLGRQRHQKRVMSP
jgi:NADPH:quinone reductase-like Zn-dependent oxidoreductase